MTRRLRMALLVGGLLIGLFPASLIVVRSARTAVIVGAFTAVPETVTTSEYRLRERATRLVRPQCEPGDVGSRLTAGVVRVLVGTGGTVLDAVALQPEGGRIAESLVNAALASTFTPRLERQEAPELLGALLTFYFRENRDQCLTFDPSELDTTASR